MTLIGMAARNLLRNKFRSIFTVVGMAVALVVFLLLRTALSAWATGVDFAAKDRVVTRHKISFVLPLPLRYVEEVRQVPGVKAVTYASWFGGKDPAHDRDEDFFASFAVDGDTYFTVYDDIVVPPDEMKRWREDRQGALIGHVLAKRFGWQVGQTVTLNGTVHPGQWRFTIDGIYTTRSKALDRSSFYFHYKHLNETTLPVMRDHVGWIVSRVDDPDRAAAIGQEIDRRFDVGEVQTQSQSERSFSTSFLAMISSVLEAMNLISIVILGILSLILANTLAMGVRERRYEHALLRAIGFMPRHIATLIVTEAVLLGVIGGGCGLLVAYGAINHGMGAWVEDSFSQFFPSFVLSPQDAALAFVLSSLLGLLSGIVLAARSTRFDVAVALRQVG